MDIILCLGGEYASQSGSSLSNWSVLLWLKTHEWITLLGYGWVQLQQKNKNNLFRSVIILLITTLVSSYAFVETLVQWDLAVEQQAAYLLWSLNLHFYEDEILMLLSLFCRQRTKAESHSLTHYLAKAPNSMRWIRANCSANIFL